MDRNGAIKYNMYPEFDDDDDLHFILSTILLWFDNLVSNCGVGSMYWINQKLIE